MNHVLMDRRRAGQQAASKIVPQEHDPKTSIGGLGTNCWHDVGGIHRVARRHRAADKMPSLAHTLVANGVIKDNDLWAECRRVDAII